MCFGLKLFKEFNLCLKKKRYKLTERITQKNFFTCSICQKAERYNKAVFLERNSRRIWLVWSCIIQTVWEHKAGSLTVPCTAASLSQDQSRLWLSVSF